MSAVPLQRPVRPAPRKAPRLRVVPPPKRKHTLVFALLTIALCAVSVFTTVAVNALAAADAVQARELEQQVGEREQRYAELVAEVASLEDPARIEATAINELGMVPASGAEFLVMEGVVPQDAVDDTDAVVAGSQTDPLKPVLSVQP